LSAAGKRKGEKRGGGERREGGCANQISRCPWKKEETSDMRSQKEWKEKVCLGKKRKSLFATGEGEKTVEGKKTKGGKHPLVGRVRS